MRGVGRGRQEPVRDTANPTFSIQAARSTRGFFNPRFLSTELHDRDRGQFEFSCSVQILAIAVRKILYREMKKLR